MYLSYLTQRLAGKREARDHKKRGFYGEKVISSKCLLGSNLCRFYAKDRRVSRTWSYKPSEDTTDGITARSGQSVGTGYTLPRACYSLSRKGQD